MTPPQDPRCRRTRPVELEITLTHNHETSCGLAFRLREIGGNLERRVDGLQPVDLALDPADVALPETAGKVGRALGQRVFGQAEARAILERGIAKAEVMRTLLRIKVYIAANADNLHAVQWETLCLPSDGRRAAADSRMPLSRYVSCRSYADHVPDPPRRIRVLQIHANPKDLARFKLTPLPIEVLTTSAGTVEVMELPDASLEAIRATLRDEFEVVCLMCHGALAGGESKFCLAGANGRANWCSGDVLAGALLAAKVRPRLVILMCCHSSAVPNGVSDDELPSDAEVSSAGQVTRSFAVHLVTAGIPAVLAMQDVITNETAQVMLRETVAALAEDGQIDRAVAVARSKVLERPDWWVPSLYIHTTTGNIWDGDVLRDGLLHHPGASLNRPVLRPERPRQAAIWVPMAASLSVWSASVLDVSEVHPLVSALALLWALAGFPVAYLSYATPEHREHVARYLRILGEQLQRASAFTVVQAARADIDWFYGGSTYSRRALTRTALIASFGIVLAHMAVMSIYGLGGWMVGLSRQFRTEVDGWMEVESSYPHFLGGLNIVLILLVMPAVLNILSDIISLVCTRAVLGRIIRAGKAGDVSDPPMRYVSIGLFVDFVLFAILAFMPVLLPYLVGHLYFVITAPTIYPGRTPWQAVVINFSYIFGSDSSVWHADTLIALCLGSAFTGCIPSLFLWVALWVALLARIRDGALFRAVGRVLVRFGEEPDNPLATAYLTLSFLAWIGLTAIEAMLS